MFAKFHKFNFPLSYFLIAILFFSLPLGNLSASEEDPPELLWSSQTYGSKAIAIAPDDGLLIYHFNRVRKLEDDGLFGVLVWEFPMPAVNGLATHADGSIYVYSAARVVKLDNDGQFVLMWGWGVLDGSFELQVCSAEDYAYEECRPSGIAGTAPGQLGSFGQLAVSPAGDVWVLDRSNFRIQRFSSEGTFIQAVGNQGSGEGQFGSAWGIDVAESGEILVADTYNHRIQVFEPDGSFSYMWGWGVATGNFELETCTSSCLPGLGGPMAGGGVAGPNGVATDANGDVYIASGYQFGSKFTLQGSFIAAWNVPGHLFDSEVNSVGDIYFIWDWDSYTGIRKYGYPYLQCVGFEFPLDSGPVTVRGRSRVLPLTAELFDRNGFEATDMDLTVPPVVQVWYKAGVEDEPEDVTEDVLTTGSATDGNEFVYLDSGVDAGKWHFALKTTNHSATGTYTLTMDSANPAEYRFYPSCSATFVRQ